jgi:predicted PhzF superfamily epimerase YddE/YHI9
MVKLKLWQVDAFAEKPLEGNPACVVPLDHWTGASLMQRIANENNVAETAFFVKIAPGRYELRWFTPTVEVALCGHATLASAWTIFEVLDPSLKTVSFETQSGTLTVERGTDGRNTMSLPSDRLEPFQPVPDYPARIAKALGSTAPSEVLKGANIVAVFDKAPDVRGLAGPGHIADAISTDMGLIVTAPGDEGFDFISRYFAPHHGIAEDPVTGSAHCSLTPYWAKRLGKKTLKARQVSPRGGNLVCTNDGERTILTGRCALYMRGEIEV